MKVTYVKVDRKRKVFDDVNFLSKKLKTSGQSSSLTLGGTPSKTKSTKAKKTHESTEPETPKVITKILLICALFGRLLKFESDLSLYPAKTHAS